MDLELCMSQPPELNRGYSDQKRQYQKAFKAVVFTILNRTEMQYRYKEQVKKAKEEEHQRHLQSLQY
jgi:hypothetical protein